MVAVGDKLGGRYFVTKLGAKVGVGSFHEVRDARSNVFYAQVLGAKPLTPSECSVLARELASIAATPALYLPEEVTQDPSGIPFAVFSRAPAPLLVDDLKLYESGGSRLRRAQTLRAFVRAFAALAEELARAAGVRSVHGAIGVQHLGAQGRDDTLQLELQGFGIEAAARIATKQEKPSPRTDAAALFLTLHELLSRTQSLPEGAPLVAWNLLVTCARAGDHPALQNLSTLGRFLREMLAGFEAAREEAPLPAAVSATTTAPANAPSPTSAVVSPPGPPAATRFELRAWIEAHRRAVLGGVVGLCLVVAVGMASLWLEPTHAPSPTPSNARPTRAAFPPAEALPVCTGESLQRPSSAEVPTSRELFDARCVDGSLHVTVAGSGGFVHATRSARRGARFSEPSARSTEGAEFGSLFGGAEASWIAWRDDRGVHVARTHETVDTFAASVPGTWRGVWLLTASTDQAWVASTLQRSEGPLAAVIRLSGGTAPEAPRVFALGEGAIEAAIVGENASLLLRRSQGRRHELSVVTVTTTVLPVLAQAPTEAADGAAGRVETVPDVALQRTAAWTVETERLHVVPTGVGRVGETRSFLVTDEDVGTVTLVTFPAQGPAVTERLSPRGTGIGLGLNGRGEPVAVLTEGDRAVLYTHVAEGAPVREPLPLQAVTQARVFPCGEEPWLTFATGTSSLPVAAVPLACVSRRALPR